ncbi:hypothetical protein [Aquella oligotrophica]|uniref:hypothetical protein n=1 Tax=Aquella oligotrophica TaxID=2067065 RepID=UPI0013156199|nr:hypothetical protein [Aquella oligotrophica]
MSQTNWNQIKENEWRSHCGRFVIVNRKESQKYHVIDELEIKVIGKFETLDQAKGYIFH